LHLPRFGRQVWLSGAAGDGETMGSPDPRDESPSLGATYVVAALEADEVQVVVLVGFGNDITAAFRAGFQDDHGVPPMLDGSTTAGGPQLRQSPSPLDSPVLPILAGNQDASIMNLVDDCCNIRWELFFNQSEIHAKGVKR
jgi:hypothetical protein